MGEMIERVARALADASESGLSADSMVVTPDSQPDAVPYWTEFEDQARIAIEAMREPTTGMILACADLPCSQQEMWELSIEAALKF